MKRLSKSIIVLATVALALLTALATVAQEDEKSALIRFVEEQISSDTYRISLNGIEGTLSSNVSLDSITISDADGTWLTISKPNMVWTRSSLLVGKLDIDSLTAERIEYLRQPLTDETLPSPEAEPFSLPDLPVSVVLEKLDVPSVQFGEAVFGLEANTSVSGSLALADGSLDVDLDIVRRDGPGGELKAVANFDGDTRNLKLDTLLREPENGIVANALGIPGRPPVALLMQGNAPVSELEVGLEFDVSDQRILTGSLNLDGTDGGTLVAARLRGPLSNILPEEHRRFFGAESSLIAQVLAAEDGALDLQRVSVSGGELTANLSGQRLADGFLSALSLDMKLRSSTGGRVTLPVASGDMSISELDANIVYDANQSSKWTANVLASAYERAETKIRQVKLDATGTLSDFSLASRRATDFEIFGSASGIESSDTGFSAAVGETINLYGSGRWRTENPVELSALRVSGQTFNFTSSGRLDGFSYDGNTVFEADQLQAFSTLAGRELAGSTRLRIQGLIDFLSGGFNLALEGSARDLKLLGNSADNLTSGTTQLSGNVSRGQSGIGFSDLQLVNNQIRARLDGRFARSRANVSGALDIFDLADLSQDAKGRVGAVFSVKGDKRPFTMKAAINLDQGKLLDRTAKNLSLQFDGSLNEDGVAGTFSSGGTLEGKPVSVNADILATPANLILRSFFAEITDTKLTGDLERDSDGLMQGQLQVDSSDIGDAAALALVEAGGGVKGRIDLFKTDQVQTVKADLALNRAMFQDNVIGKGSLVATVMDVFGTPRIGATIDGSDIRIGGTSVRQAQVKVGTVGDLTDYSLDARLRQYAAIIKSNGSIKQREDRTEVTIQSLDLQSEITNARLQAPSSIILTNGVTRISPAVLQVGKGQVSIEGAAEKNLDFRVALKSLPVSIVNTVAPGTGAGGTVSGNITIAGSPSAPTVRFDMNGNALTVAQLQESGIAPLVVAANGSFQNGVVDLNAANVRNAQNISVTASGRVPLSGNGLNLRANGTAPLELASGALRSRGARVSGSANFDASLRGSLAAPSANGAVTIAGASFTDPQSNLRLLDINLRAGLTGESVTITNGSARLGSGGAVTLSGRVGLTDAFPANLSIRLNEAHYSDGQTFSTTANGTLSITGSLLQDPLLSGDIFLAKTEITVPESFASDAELLQVEHVDPSASTQETLARRDQANPEEASGTGSSIMRLDLTINAPNQIFVRGRGLDAELGGNIRISGPASNIQPFGRFELRRGRLSVLGQRISLTEGSISLSGDLDPVIDFLAQTDAGDVTAFIRVSGRVSSVDVTFFSSPELPQDEVLARIVFGRSLSDLSPIQIARLASVAAELTGGKSPGLVEGIRGGVGLDDLDVVEDEDGNTAVQAGKYVTDNVYLGVQAGRKSEATINLDITDNLTARGTVSSQGDTSLGIFLEKDY